PICSSQPTPPPAATWYGRILPLQTVPFMRATTTNWSALRSRSGTYTSHATALITAAIMPMMPASIANVLITPPRVRDENDSATPSNPKKIAMHARIRPSIAPVMKLAIAATRAMIEGILNFAARGADVGPSIMYNYALVPQLTQPLKYPIFSPLRWG